MAVPKEEATFHLLQVTTKRTRAGKFNTTYLLSRTTATTPAIPSRTGHRQNDRFACRGVDFAVMHGDEQPIVTFFFAAIGRRG